MNVFLIGVVLLLSACATPPKQTVNSVAVETLPEEVCVVENPAVSHKGFLIAYKDALEKRGIAVKMLPPGSATSECEWTSTYTANWRWDLAMYMAKAKILIFRDEWPEGEASYNGGYGLGKFISAEEKIRELVGKLFPYPDVAKDN